MVGNVSPDVPHCQAASAHVFKAVLKPLQRVSVRLVALVVRTLGEDAAIVTTATLNYYLNPLDLQSLTAPLLGIIDDALLLAVAAKKCRDDLDRYIKFKSTSQTDS